MDVRAETVKTQFCFSLWQTNCTVHIMFSGALTQHAPHPDRVFCIQSWEESNIEPILMTHRAAAVGRRTLTLSLWDCTEKLVRLSRHLRECIHFPKQEYRTFYWVWIKQEKEKNYLLSLYIIYIIFLSLSLNPMIISVLLTHCLTFYPLYLSSVELSQTSAGIAAVFTKWVLILRRKGITGVIGITNGQRIQYLECFDWIIVIGHMAV